MVIITTAGDRSAGPVAEIGVGVFTAALREAIAAGDRNVAQAALRAAQPEIQRAAIKRIVTKNAAARRVSRLAARIKAMA